MRRAYHVLVLFASVTTQVTLKMHVSILRVTRLITLAKYSTLNTSKGIILRVFRVSIGIVLARHTYSSPMEDVSIGIVYRGNIFYIRIISPFHTYCIPWEIAFHRYIVPTENPNCPLSVPITTVWNTISIGRTALWKVFSVGIVLKHVTESIPIICVCSVVPYV